MEFQVSLGRCENKQGEKLEHKQKEAEEGCEGGICTYFSIA